MEGYDDALKEGFAGGLKGSFYQLHFRWHYLTYTFLALLLKFGSRALANSGLFSVWLKIFTPVAHSIYVWLLGVFWIRNLAFP